MAYMAIGGSVSEDVLAQATATFPGGRTSIQVATVTIRLAAGDTVALFGRQYNGNGSTQPWAGTFSGQRLGD